MFSKFFALLIFGFITTAVRGDIYDTAATLIDDLQIAVTNAINTHVPELRLLSSEVDAAANLVLVQAQLDLQVILEGFEQTINELRQEGEEAGIDQNILEECIETYSYELEHLPHNVEQGIILCLNGTVVQARDIIDRNIEHIQHTQNVVDRLDLQLQQCRLIPEPEGTNCVLFVIGATSVELVDLPATVQEDTDQTKAVVAALQVNLDPCAADRLDVVPGVGNHLIEFMRECAGLPTKS